MAINNIGRPIDPHAITKTGRAVTIWLSASDTAKLDAICKRYRLSKSDAIRRLVKDTSL